MRLQPEFRPRGAANCGGASAFPPALVDLSESRLERAAAARIGGPTIAKSLD